MVFSGMGPIVGFNNTSIALVVFFGFYSMVFNKTSTSFAWLRINKD